MTDTATNRIQNVRANDVRENLNFSSSGENAFSRILGLSNSPAVSKAMPIVIAALIIAVVVAFFAFSQRSNVTTIYDDLPETERSQVLNALVSAGYAASVHPTSGKIQIPTRDYHEAKLTLAGQGLPTATSDGYEKLSDLPMGASKSIEAMKLKQSQEIEIARSIMSLKAVRDARVHLAIPEKSVFIRERSTPSASVFLTLNYGQSLNETQVNAIVNLVAQSVSGLSTDEVTVVDENGKLLTTAASDPETTLSNSDFRYRMRLEEIYKRRIEEILSPLVGAGNASAQVNIAIDTTRVEFTEEVFDPQKNAVISEQKSVQKRTNNALASGVPGATSNRPPEGISVNQSATDAASEETKDPNTAVETPKSNTPTTESITENRSYEVSKVIKTTRAASNQILKLDAAVLLRKPKIMDTASGKLVPKEYTTEKLDEIENLIKSTIGFENNRGDTLALSVSDFEPVVATLTTNWYETDWFQSISQNIGMVLMLGIVVLGIIRPLLNRLLIPVNGGEISAPSNLDSEVARGSMDVRNSDGIDEIISKLRPKNSGISLEMLDTANTYDDKVAIVKMLVEDESKRASNVLRQMMQQDKNP